MRALSALVLAAVTGFAASLSAAQEAGVVKVSKGAATVQRAGQALPAKPGLKVLQGDLIVTGTDGAVGVTFTDNSLVSTGPNSVFSVDKYLFDPTTHAGQFDGTLRKGTLAGISGKMVKAAPESMRIATPSSIMGVRGTEFAVQVENPDGATGQTPVILNVQKAAQTPVILKSQK
ncbi:MAG: FecR domain-containing protein [Betaproteobacteria bacterium]|nr:FecR domain-containing protein [Betaproteobacteria bacterium]